MDILAQAAAGAGADKEMENLLAHVKVLSNRAKGHRQRQEAAQELLAAASDSSLAISMSLHEGGTFLAHLLDTLEKMTYNPLPLALLLETLAKTLADYSVKGPAANKDLGLAALRAIARTHTSTSCSTNKSSDSARSSDSNRSSGGGLLEVVARICNSAQAKKLECRETPWGCRPHLLNTVAILASTGCLDHVKPSGGDRVGSGTKPSCPGRQGNSWLRWEPYKLTLYDL